MNVYCSLFIYFNFYCIYRSTESENNNWETENIKNKYVSNSFVQIRLLKKDEFHTLHHKKIH
jgi:hypothetical protein